MTQPWATGLDLHLDLDRNRVRSSMEALLREAVRTGRLRPGATLPASRSLARDLGVARNTVVEVYGQLVAEGWLSARVGAGTVVADRAVEVPVAAPRVVESYPAVAEFDLRAGWPDLAAFPRREWLRAARQALAAAPAASLNYSDPRGRRELREALSDYLARVRGVRADPNQIVVCLGITHGLSLAAEALVAGGARSWAIESYGIDVLRQPLRAAGLRLELLPVDRDGADVAGLDQVDVAQLAPAHQFPLGVTLSPQRRRDIVRWSHTTGGMIVEDDYDGEFRYDRRPVGALQALAPERVVYAGTASKSLAPGLRLGWLVVPPQLLEPVTAAKSLFRGHNSVLDQLTLADFLRSGAYDRHVRRMRLKYQRRRNELAQAISTIPGVELSGVDAGLHALLRLPTGVAEQDVVDCGRRHELVLEGLNTFRANGADDYGPALVIGYAGPPDDTYPATLERLLTTLRASVLRPTACRAKAPPREPRKPADADHHAQ